MPATEASVSAAHSDERKSYEFAFHVLPTVAEGEVPGVFGKIKAHISTAGGECFDEEVPERIDLAYPIVKQIEGKNRKFTSAYFGWVRFRIAPEFLEPLTEELENESNILRHLIIKLTKVEEERPYKFHENRKKVKMVEVLDEEPGIMKETKTETEEKVEVSEAELEESLEKITGDEQENEKAV